MFYDVWVTYRLQSDCTETDRHISHDRAHAASYLLSRQTGSCLYPRDAKRRPSAYVETIRRTPSTKQDYLHQPTTSPKRRRAVQKLRGMSWRPTFTATGPGHLPPKTTVVQTSMWVQFLQPSPTHEWTHPMYKSAVVDISPDLTVRQVFAMLVFARGQNWRNPVVFATKHTCLSIVHTVAEQCTLSQLSALIFTTIYRVQSVNSSQELGRQMRDVLRWVGVATAWKKLHLQFWACFC